jgi:hypothetical protein
LIGVLLLICPQFRIGSSLSHPEISLGSLHSGHQIIVLSSWYILSGRDILAKIILAWLLGMASLEEPLLHTTLLKQPGFYPEIC